MFFTSNFLFHVILFLKIPTILFASNFFLLLTFFSLLIFLNSNFLLHFILFLKIPTFFYYFFFTSIFFFHFQLFFTLNLFFSSNFLNILIFTCFTTYYFCFLTCDKTDLGDSWICRKHERTRQSNITVFWCRIAFIHGENTSFSTLETALPRNGKATRPLVRIKYSQKELFDAVKSEPTRSSNNVGCILISNGIMYRRENDRKTARQKDPAGV